MEYSNPGLIFLDRYGKIETIEDVLAYVEFLRKETGINDSIPVNLNNIYRHFNFPEPKNLPLPSISGMLVDSKNGIILINSEDLPCRQKFTQAHELIEVLFDVLPQGKDLGNGWKLIRPGGFKESAKENLCDYAAACLLMPNMYIAKLIQKIGVNFDCARKVANECEVSLSAALIQLVRLSPFLHSVVLWKMKHKPSEKRNITPESQLYFFDLKPIQTSTKLRVEWSSGNSKSPFIPKDKSIEESSLIYQAWQSRIYNSGIENLNITGKKNHKYKTQNYPFINQEETYVLSLLEYLE